MYTRGIRERSIINKEGKEWNTEWDGTMVE